MNLLLELFRTLPYSIFMKVNDPNKAVRNRRCDKKRNNDSTKVRGLVNAVRRNAQGKMN